jgi:hypothetical protein
VANWPVEAVALLSFGEDDPALLRLVVDTSRRGRPAGEGFKPRLRRHRGRHTAWSQSERADRITNSCFQPQLTCRALT